MISRRPMSETRPVLRDPLATALLFIAAMTAWRLAVLAFAAPALSFDEAQYWAWAQTLQFGYYSKPPMVAWAIAATTALFGEGEGAIKLGSALAHAGTALVLLALGRTLYGPRVGAWAGALWATLPAVSLSSVMITTDPFLLFFWALALLAVVRAAEAGPRPNRWWVLLGVAFGLGLLAKYAMVLFLVSLAIWMAWSRERRGLVRAPGLWLAGGLGLAIYAPNAVWNALNGFVSYAHTKANANLKGSLFHPDKLVEFVVGQFAVFGPIAMAALLLALVGALRRPADGTGKDDRDRLLAAFTLPMLVLMAVESVLSRANANWTGPAFVGGVVLVAAFLSRRAPRLLAVIVALHVAVAAGMYFMDPLRAALRLPDTQRFDPMKRLRAWDEVGRQVSAILAAHPQARMMGDERKVMATLTYYVHPHPFNAVKWNPDGIIDDWFDQTTRLEPGERELIYVTETPQLRRDIRAGFDGAEQLAQITIPVHTDYARTLTVWRLTGFKGYRR